MINLFEVLKNKLHIFLFATLCTRLFLFDQGSELRADDLRGYPTSVVFREIEGNASGTQRSVFLFTTDSTLMNWSSSKNASWITTNITDWYYRGSFKDRSEYS